MRNRESLAVARCDGKEDAMGLIEKSSAIGGLNDEFVATNLQGCTIGPGCAAPWKPYRRSYTIVPGAPGVADSPSAVGRKYRQV